MLAGIGFACLFYPAQVQRWAVKAVESGPSVRIPGVRDFVASRGYLIIVRAVGVGALLMGAFLIWGVINYYLAGGNAGKKL